MTYYLGEGSIQSGPFTLEQLRTQNVRPGTLVWCEGFSNWVRADTVAELQFLFTPPEPVIQPPPADPDPAITNAPTEWPSAAPVTLGGAPSPMPVQPLGYEQSMTHLVNNQAIAALVLGILACSFLFMFCFPISIVLGVLALIFGAKGRGRPVGQGMALAGMITGGIGLALGIIIGLLIFIGSMA